MSKNTRKMTLSALFSALSVIVLFIASVWPTGLYGIVAFASLFVAAAVIETGVVYGVYVFIVSSVLGLLLLPDKEAPLLYIVFFGYYPVLKNLIERIGSRDQENGVMDQETGETRGVHEFPKAAQWFLKLAVFNVALTIMWVLLKELLMGINGIVPGVLIVYLLGNAVFILFDYGYSKVLLFYIERVSKAIGNRE